MNNNRLGCFSPPAIIASLLTLLVIAGFAFTSGSGLFTAGNLNANAGKNIGGVTSHAEIGNACAKCHPAPWDADTLGDRCQVCHTDISAQLTDPTSLHGEMMKNQSITCRACHPEHRGPNAALTDMQSGNFPHDKTGYSLNSHKRRSDGQPFTCSDCHGNDITKFDPAVCTICHQQMDKVFMAAHTLAYGTDCKGCHDGIETIGKNFDHARAAFKLEGKHTGLLCMKCHLNAHAAADFKSAPTDCGTCHQKDDAHKGEFGKECGTCHKPAAWKPATFDHNLSAFKLEGKHAEAKCTDCHINNVFKGTPSNCYACHQKDDEHNGKFGQDCAACHSTSGWKPATFDHNLSAFKLDGAHAIVACEKCHINNVFKGTPIECSGCHQDPAFHLGLFAGTSCSKCHNTDSWLPALFNLSHPEPTNGGEGGSGVHHGNATCRDCHTVNLMTATCTKCHDSNSPSGGD